MKGFGALDKKLKQSAIGALTRAYTDILSRVKYTEAFAYIKENKGLCEFDNIVNGLEKITSCKLFYENLIDEIAELF